MKNLNKLIFILFLIISMSGMLYSHVIEGGTGLQEETIDLFIPYISESHIYTSVYNYGTSDFFIFSIVHIRDLQADFSPYYQILHHQELFHRMPYFVTFDQQLSLKRHH